MVKQKNIAKQEREAVAQSFAIKRGLLKFSLNSHENTCARISGRGTHNLLELRNIQC